MIRFWRNVRALWRLGSFFECAMWSMMFWQLQQARFYERWSRVYALKSRAGTRGVSS